MVIDWYLMSRAWRPVRKVDSATGWKERLCVLFEKNALIELKYVEGERDDDRSSPAINFQFYDAASAG